MALEDPSFLAAKFVGFFVVVGFVFFSKFLQRGSLTILLNIIFFQCCLVLLFWVPKQIPTLYFENAGQSRHLRLSGVCHFESAVQKHIIAFYSLHP